MSFRLICCLLIGWGSIATSGCAQTTPLAHTNQLLAADSNQFVLVSGKLKPNFSWELSPGGSYALKFTPPVASQHRLSGIRLHFQPFGRHKAQGRVRIRVVQVAVDGSPADDYPLLPPALITEQTLQELKQPLALTFPTILVPTTGFFVVLEGVGEAPDEYVITSPHLVLAGPGNCLIGRRSQPDAPPRQLSTWSIPGIQGAKRTDSLLEFWMRGGDLPGWRSFPESKRVPLVEVGFR